MKNNTSFAMRVKKDFKRNKFKYMLIAPVIVYFILFAYKPMYGIVVAFQKYRLTAGIGGSPWVGFYQFERFFTDPYFFRLLRNTFSISLLYQLCSNPAPIILALLLNEVRCRWFKRTVQTISYMPHFISLVVTCSLVTYFSASEGLFNQIIVFFGGERSALLSRSDMFYPIYILSGIWKGVGWSSIIYLAALAGIDQEQYEAARVDGAGRMKQMLYITLPGLVPTMAMLWTLDIGQLLSVGYEKIMLLYQPLTYDVADVISTYVYRKGIEGKDFSYSTAIGLFNSVINLGLLITANKLSKKLGQSGLF